MGRLLLFLLLAGATTGGCIPWREHRVATARAEADLGCSDVEVTGLPGNGFIARGCGQTEQLTCSTTTNRTILGDQHQTTCFTGPVQTDEVYEPSSSRAGAAPPETTVDGEEARRAALRLALLSIPHEDCGRGGAGALEITFSPAGSTTDVEVVAGEFDDATKECLVARYATTRVAPFTGPPRAYRWGVRLPE